MKRGHWYALAAYGCWGLFPLYWKALAHVPALQLLGHRVVWSCLLLGGVLVATRQLDIYRTALRDRRVVGVYLLAALLIAVNWGVYIWAVGAGFIVETSLGYFINPLVNVLLGLVVLGERLRRAQWVPLALAAAGVGYLTWAYGQPPWIALTLAFSFGFYGLVKKRAPLGAAPGLALETTLLFAPAFALLAATDVQGTGALFHHGWTTDALLVGAGTATTIPLLFFTAAAQRLPLSTLGLFQYLAPTVQFALGVAVFHEPFSTDKLIGFAFVWAALLLFVGESLWARKTIRT